MRHIALLVLLTGCGADCPPEATLGDDGLCYLADAEGDDGDSVDEGDTGPSAAMNITAEVSEQVHTVVTVRWETEAAATGYVEFGPDDSYGERTPLGVEGTSHEVLVLGLWADTEFHFRVVSTGADGQEATSADQVVTTGSLPVEIPVMTITGEPTWEGFLFAPFQGINYLAVVVDNQGRVVLYRVVDSDTHHIMRAEPMPDGSGVAICMAGQDSQGNKDEGYVLIVSMDGAEEVEVEVPYIDHDMTIMPDGTIAAIVLKEQEGYAGQADSIQEVALDGGMTEIFDAWDHVDWLPDREPAREGSGGGNNWTHANALDYVERDDAYYMAMKELHTMVKVDRASGEVQWAIGGQGDQFTWPDDQEPLSMHHQFHAYAPGRLLVFENGDPSRGYSQVRELVLDEENLTAEEVWSYRHDPPVYVFAKGDVERLDSGNTLVTWSSSGEIQEVRPDGSVQWQFNTELGAAITFVTRTESLYGQQ
ncbi:MAG: hypothetical protein ACI8S6_000346 [Myxococcota bacterium]